MAPIGEWVLGEACARIRRSIDSGIPLPARRVSVNVSSTQFRQEHFVNSIRKAVDEADIDAESLCLELTERLLVENFEETSDKVTELKSMGIRFSIDDFGTGYSSLSYLKRLPVDALKIDRSFVSDVHNDSSDGAIVEAIVAMARHMDLAVIAEGVETVDEFRFLDNQDCRAFQGFYFSHPVAEEDYVNRLREDLERRTRPSPVDGDPLWH